MVPSRGLVDDHGRHPPLVRPAPPGSCAARPRLNASSSWDTERDTGGRTRSTEHVGPSSKAGFRPLIVPKETRFGVIKLVG